MTDSPPTPHRVLLSYAPPEAYAPHTRAILAKLGYAIVLEPEFNGVASELGRERPDLCIVDERNLVEVQEDPDLPPIPIIVLTGRHGVTGADVRIVGAIRRPAGLHEIYRLAQEVLEDLPRSTPRVPTHLMARCRRGDREWKGSVLSLSENGCLLRSPEPLHMGEHIELQFEIPRFGTLCLEAETAYQLLPDLGMIFHGTSPSDREAVGQFVSQLLIAL